MFIPSDSPSMFMVIIIIIIIIITTYILLLEINKYMNCNILSIFGEELLNSKGPPLTTIVPTSFNLVPLISSIDVGTKPYSRA